MKFTTENAKTMGSRGGLKTFKLYGREHMQTIGAEGFRVTVERHFNGDARRAVNVLIGRGLAAIDPVPENGAWTNRPGEPVRDRLPKDWVAPAHRAIDKMLQRRREGQTVCAQTSWGRTRAPECDGN